MKIEDKKVTTTKHNSRAVPDILDCYSIFNERQQDIINGVHVDNLKNSEILRVVKKAENYGMDELAMDVYLAYENRLIPPKPKYEYTIEECKEILQSYVPFEINWDD